MGEFQMVALLAPARRATERAETLTVGGGARTDQADHWYRLTEALMPTMSAIGQKRTCNAGVKRSTAFRASAWTTV